MTRIIHPVIIDTTIDTIGHVQIDIPARTGRDTYKPHGSTVSHTINARVTLPDGKRYYATIYRHFDRSAPRDSGNRVNRVTWETSLQTINRNNRIVTVRDTALVEMRKQLVTLAKEALQLSLDYCLERNGTSWTATAAKGNGGGHTPLEAINSIIKQPTPQPTGDATSLTIKATWNGKIVLEGRSTLAMAYSITRNMITDNFGDDAAQGLSLSMIDAVLRKCGTFNYSHSDDTGAATITVKRHD